VALLCLAQNTLVAASFMSVALRQWGIVMLPPDNRGVGAPARRTAEIQQKAFDERNTAKQQLDRLTLGAQHGWAIAERVQQVSSDFLRTQQGRSYRVLHRLERRGWIKAHWGTSVNNRRAKYYELTKSGHKQLEVEKDTWERLTVAVAQVLETV
jgi:PadR family transcriptional regulator PadR